MEAKLWEKIKNLIPVIVTIIETILEIFKDDEQKKLN